MGDANFLKRLYDYDKDNIPEKILRALKKYIDNPKFVPEIVEKTSKVCSTSPKLFQRVFVLMTF